MYRFVSTRSQLGPLFWRLSIASAILGFVGAALALSLPASGDGGWLLLRRALISIFVGALVGLALAVTSLVFDPRSRPAKVLVVLQAALLLMYAFIP